MKNKVKIISIIAGVVILISVGFKFGKWVQILNFLNQNRGAFSVLFAGIVAFATIVYALLTRKLVTETEKLRKVETEPNIAIFLQPKERYINLIDLVIENIGNGPAYEMFFRLNPDFKRSNGQFLSSYPFMKMIKYLAPHQKIQFYLDSAIDVLNDPKREKRFNVTAFYQDRNSQKYEESFLLDFEGFKGMPSVGEPADYKMAKEIENIKKILEKITSRTFEFDRLKVETWTPKDKKEAVHELKKEMRKSKHKPN